MIPPLSQKKYWKLEDSEPNLKEMASSILLHYIQNWGQPNEKRLDILAEVVNKIGFHIEVVENKGVFVFKIPDSESQFEEMRDKFRDIRRGNFESEVVQIADILQEYRIKKPWWKFW